MLLTNDQVTCWDTDIIETNVTLRTTVDLAHQSCRDLPFVLMYWFQHHDSLIGEIIFVVHDQKCLIIYQQQGMKLSCSFTSMHILSACMFLNWINVNCILTSFTTSDMPDWGIRINFKLLTKH